MTLADQESSAVVAANNVAEIEFRPSGRQSWVVQQISTNAPTVGVSAACSVYRDSTKITDLVASGDVAADLPYLPVRTGQRVRVRWTGATVGAVVHAIMFYDDGQR